MIILTPAYGRDYKGKQAAIDDLNAEKDFILNDLSSPQDGMLVNKRQLVADGVTQVKLRYNKRRDSSVVEVDD